MFSSITLALTHKKSTTGTFRKGPKLIHVLILSERAPQIHGDGAKRRDVSGDKRLVFTVVAAEIENLRGQKSKCCFYLCHCLTLPLGFIHLDIFEPGKIVTLQSHCLTHLHFYAVVFLSDIKEYKAPLNPHIYEKATSGMAIKRLETFILTLLIHSIHKLAVSASLPKTWGVT